MLQKIQQFVMRYTNIIATVTGIDIEVVDSNLVRVAGTGMYAEGVGKSLQAAGQIYRHGLASGETMFVETPREHAVCEGCPNLVSCRETLSLCTPITANNGEVAGIIGLVCFNEQERNRVLAQKDVYIDFVRQIAEVLGKEVQEQRRSEHTRNLLDALLQVVDGNSRGILVLSAEGRITYMNDMARQELELERADLPHSVAVRKTGDELSDMEEFDVTVNGRSMLIMGKLSPLDTNDPSFDSVLAFDSLPRLAERLAGMTSSTESTGGLAAIYGQSRPLRQLAKKVRQIADSPSTVLISGESGTGKEMFARAIHEESDRRDKPFIAVNCGAIPDALLESELFGYVRGAFTGAGPSGRMGKFELAHKGVIFLDEIGAMPLYLQVKLLRVLQERRITRLGSNRLVDVDVRIIAATNDNLQAMMRQHMFREDLFYRLNVIPLDIPPLRERKEDIPVLARHFLEKYCRRFNKPAGKIPDNVLEVFAEYSWPGNVREFENIMEYLANIMPSGGTVAVSMLPPGVRRAEEAAQGRKGKSLPAQAPADEMKEEPLLTLAEMERNALRRALARFGTDAAGKQAAAKALGIGIATLYRKLKEVDELS